jgi:hypothetical protein
VEWPPKCIVAEGGHPLLLLEATHNKWGVAMPTMEGWLCDPPSPANMRFSDLLMIIFNDEAFMT